MIQIQEKKLKVLWLVARQLLGCLFVFISFSELCYDIDCLKMVILVQPILVTIALNSSSDRSHRAMLQAKSSLLLH